MKSALRVAGSALWISLVLVLLLKVRIGSAYWGTALFSSLIFYLARRPKLAWLYAILSGSVALGFVYLRVMHEPLVLLEPGACLGIVGLGALLVVGLRALWSDAKEEREILVMQNLLPTGLLCMFLFASNNLVTTGLWHPKTLDLYAYSFDGSLGFQPSFLLGQLFQRYTWFGWPTVAVYYCVLLPIPLAYVAYNKKFGNDRRFFMLEVFFSASFIGYLFYNLFPAAGPVYVFGRYFPWGFLPASRLILAPIPMHFSVMRNALPSLHMTWSLLIWWNMKAVSRTAYWLAFVYVLLTICGTLGTGEHYAVDLVASFPFALMIQAICTSWVPARSRVRSSCIAGGLAGILCWIALLRYANRLFWVSPVVPWVLTALTVYLSLRSLYMLLKAAEPTVAVQPETAPELCPA